MIPKHVTKIGKYAFSCCNSLTKIDFQSNSELKIIGNRSFNESSTKSIIIPRSVYIIGSKAFNKCKEIKTIDFQNESELKIIGKKLFNFHL